MSLSALVQRLADKASAETSARVRHLRRASDTEWSPEREVARAEIALSVHGIHVEHWSCTCGAPYQYPQSLCHACKRPYPRACSTSGCGAINAPEVMVTVAGLRVEHVRASCASCAGDVARKARAESYARSSIPPREREWGKRVLLDYQHQAGAWQVIEAWLARGPDSRTWRREKRDLDAHLGGTCALYLSGCAGAGKSVVAASTVHKAFVVLGLVSEFRWYSQVDLAQLFAERFVGDEDDRARAVAQWRAATECQLLVIDDLFVTAPTPAFGHALASLIRERLDHMRPMILTSNATPVWGLLESDEVGRIESRWAAYGLELVITGVDLRRAA